jgi:hypothetical protein
LGPENKFAMKITLIPLLLFTAVACTTDRAVDHHAGDIDELARQYVQLGLAIGQYDGAFVDAYYGPDSLRPLSTPAEEMPRDSFLMAVDNLYDQFQTIANDAVDDTLRVRAQWASDQLVAFRRRIQIFTGEYGTFDEESRDLFGVVAPHYTEDQFKSWLSRLDSLLPGSGDVSSRYQALANRFTIPKEKLDTVFRLAIEECRKRTLRHVGLPAAEDFSLEYVTDKPWSGYNWYQGNYKSLIQINTDLPILIDRAIEIGSHESYPGHHVYNMLLEKNLYRDEGFLEISLYPLFSPQSLIAEGSANFGVDVVLPGHDKVIFSREVLLPAAGLDTLGIALYFKALELKGKLTYARNEVGRGIIDNTMSEEDAMRWLTTYGLYSDGSARKSIDFIRTNRTYIINYNYGMDLVKMYIESRGGVATQPDRRWELFAQLLSNQVRISELAAQ